MHSVSRLNVHWPTRFIAFAAGTLLLLASAAPALAAEVQQGDTITIGPDQVINDDVYAFGSNVQILGTVNGDIFAAGNNVTIGGTVTGSVFAAGNTVAIPGEVRHAVHAAGNTVALSGRIGEDATLASNALNLSPGSVVGRDLLLAGGTANLMAPIGRNVRAAAGDLTLAAPVGGDMQAQVTTLHVLDGASVNGALTYTSSNDASIAPGVSVAGGVQHLLPQTETQPADRVPPLVGVVDWLRGLVGFAVIGLLFTLLVPRFSASTIDVARTAYWSSLGIGLALFLGTPILALLVFIVGIFLGGWALGLAVLAMLAMASAIGVAFAAMFTGNVLVQAFRQPSQHLAWNLLEGLAVLGLVGLLPVVGGIVLFLACVFGLGAFALNIARTYRASRGPGVITPITAPVQPQLVAA